MSSPNIAMVNIDDIEHCRERWRYYACLRRQGEDNETKNIWLARHIVPITQDKQQTLGGDHI